MNSYLRALGRCGTSGRGTAGQDGLWVARTHYSSSCACSPATPNGNEKTAGTSPVRWERSGCRPGAARLAGHAGEAFAFGRKQGHALRNRGCKLEHLLIVFIGEGIGYKLDLLSVLPRLPFPRSHAESLLPAVAESAMGK